MHTFVLVPRRVCFVCYAPVKKNKEQTKDVLRQSHHATGTRLRHGKNR